ncbi:hypothetical protein SynNOUM97013_02434 [Synechococcus sp. NOUM97013]|nr:hypothetical protein SynNOUM97013_02434 [Synechococcus sp. NOUM97013]
MCVGIERLNRVEDAATGCGVDVLQQNQARQWLLEAGLSASQRSC